MMIEVDDDSDRAVTPRRVGDSLRAREDSRGKRSLGRSVARSFLGFSIFDSRFLFFSSFDLMR